jgi:RNA polymerase sigma-70 factor (ECF subfamily)
MVDARARRAAWVAAHVMPCEPDVRRWLARSRVPAAEIDDLVQYAYCRFAELESVEAIVDARAYFFEIVRRSLRSNVRRQRVVAIETVAEIEALNVYAEDPSPERVVAARRELDEVLRLIGRLPDRCRRVFEMRKIQGLSQREIAGRLGVTETIVENDVVKGLRLISRALSQSVAGGTRGVSPRDHERSRIRRPD